MLQPWKAPDNVRPLGITKCKLIGPCASVGCIMIGHNLRIWDVTVLSDRAMIIVTVKEPFISLYRMRLRVLHLAKSPFSRNGRCFFRPPAAAS